MFWADDRLAALPARFPGIGEFTGGADCDASETMLVLFETPAGFALFKVKDEAKIASADDIGKEFSTPDRAASL